jgi:trans-aconitate methyltransferase
VSASTGITGQRWDADAYARHGGFVADLANSVLELLAPKNGDRILDVGCGDGVLTAKIAAAGAIVVGVDTAPDLLRAARRGGIDAREIDAQHLPFSSEFDAVFSNAALHWVKDHDAVLAGVHRALKPRGRFVAEMGGHGNLAAICTAIRAVLQQRGIAAEARNPWFYPTATEYSSCLRAHGFSVETITLIPRLTALPTGMRGWLDTFANPFVFDLNREQRANVFDEVCALLAPSLRDGDGNWTADYVRLRFRCTRD